MKVLSSLFLILSSFIIISCGDNNTVNQTNEPQPIYSHSTIELSGPGLQEYHDTIPLTFENTDSVYAEFWSETNIDTTDYVLVSVAIYDTAAAGGTYFSNFFTENTVDLNRVHGFGFKLVNSTIKLEISVLKGSIDDKYLRLRNFNIYKK
ncbi:MAG: hypothetical protein ABI543_03080 [Ignavibacteria bacterium]